MWLNALLTDPSIRPVLLTEIIPWTSNYAHTFPWWRHQMETFSALLAICAGNSPVPGEFPAQRPVTRSFDVFFDLNKRLSKQSWGWWFQTLSRPLWRHCHVHAVQLVTVAPNSTSIRRRKRGMEHLLHPVLKYGNRYLFMPEPIWVSVRN